MAAVSYSSEREVEVGGDWKVWLKFCVVGATST